MVGPSTGGVMRLDATTEPCLLKRLHDALLAAGASGSRPQMWQLFLES